MATVAQVQIKESCLSLMDTIRQSSLNFSLQETPFSLYITIRKSFTKSRNLHSQVNQNLMQIQAEKSPAKSDPDILQSRLKLLEDTYAKLKSDFEDEVN